MAFLSRVEEIILLSIYKLGDKAFGVSIIENVEKDTGTAWMSGSIYGGLTRLKKNGYISSTTVKQSPDQVGRPRIYYQITPAGLDKLIALQKVSRSIWLGIPDLEKSR